MGVLGWATLEEIDDEIAIQPGPGAVVTGTFAHISDAVIDLQIEGQPKPIGCTTTHPFWSVDRQDFVEAGRLQQGERVQLYSGETKRVVQKLPRPGPVNVYNLEVYAEHVYSVTPDGVLAHNSCDSPPKYRRPYIRKYIKERLEDIWEINKLLDPVKYDYPRNKMHIGHKFGVEHKRLLEWIKDVNIIRNEKKLLPIDIKDWNDLMNNANLYELQYWLENCSHNAEDKSPYNFEATT
ncbi:MAG: hypothetical protein IKY61_00895, partial [Thermoguttaceae bacterium]|nr:hypothetical protein [Thermoguttaceae bacterium]